MLFLSLISFYAVRVVCHKSKGLTYCVGISFLPTDRTTYKVGNLVII
jgi:hypothetical protein